MRLSAAVLSVEMYSVLANAHGGAFVVTEQHQQPQQLQQKQRPLGHAPNHGAATGSSATDALSGSMSSAAMLGTVAAATAAASMGLARKQRTSRSTTSIATLMHAFESELGVQDPVELLATFEEDVATIRHVHSHGVKLFYLQLEFFCLQLSFCACILLRCLLDALAHCKQKNSNYN